MKALITAILSIVLTASIAGMAYLIGKKSGDTFMDLNVLVGSIKESVNAEQKYNGIIWYKACPDKIGGFLNPPRILMVYPINFEFKTSIDDARFAQKEGGKVSIRFNNIRIENAALQTEYMAHMANGGWWIQREDPYVQKEIERAPHIIRFIAYQTLKSGLKNIREKMQERVAAAYRPVLRKDVPMEKQLAFEWDEDAQKKYMERYERSVIQPPFGAKGCDADWFYLGGKPYNFAGDSVLSMLN